MAPLDELQIRENLEHYMRATLADEAAHGTWHYHAVRPCVVPEHWHPGQQVYGDCSKGVQFLDKWAGAPDPMWERGSSSYGPYGNSATLAAKLKHLDHPSELQIGDDVTFGHYGNSHAAKVLEPGNDPLLWSFGHPGAPNTYRLSHDRRERQYLQLHLPPHKLTPVEKLKAMTGYWSWLQWKLGEGHWRGFGPEKAFVRPNVPRVIPREWWKRYIQYLLNRKKPNKLSLATAQITADMA